MEPENQKPTDDGKATTLQIPHNPTSNNSSDASSPKPALEPPVIQDSTSLNKSGDIPAPATGSYADEIKEIQAAYKKNLDPDSDKQEKPKKANIYSTYTQPTPQPITPAIETENPLPVTQSMGTDQSARVYTDENQERLVEDTEQKNKWKKQLIKVFGSASAFVIILGGIIGWYFLIYTHVGYKKFTISNDGYKYSFLYYSDAIEGSRDGYNQLSGRLRNPVIVAPAKSPVEANCDQVMSSPTIIFHASFQDNAYPVCLDSTKASLLGTFKYDGVWQEVYMYSIDGKSPIDTKTVRTLFTSLAVSH